MNIYFFWIAWLIALIVEFSGIHNLVKEIKKKRTLYTTLKKILFFQPYFVILLITGLINPFAFNLSLALTGLVFLIRYADIFVEGAETIALKLNISPIVIGILIVGFGTSAPEFFVNTLSAIQGKTEVAFGNIIGSNIANMGIVIGVAGIMSGKFKIKKSIITTEMPIMLAATLLLMLLSVDISWFTGVKSENAWKGLSRQDGTVLLFGIVMYLFYMFHSITNTNEAKEVEKDYNDKYKGTKVREWGSPILQILGGIVGLYVGGEFTISGSVAIAKSLGAGIIVVGVIIGVGTSLPELATAVTSALKKQTDLIIGNVVGSNIFNILLILGCTAMIKPVEFSSRMTIHLYILLTMSLMFFLFLWTKRELSKIESVILAISGIGYILYCIFTN